MSGRIYKITGYGLTYYGSTRRTLNHRKQKHKDHYKEYKSGNRDYMSSYDILEQGDDWNIELVEIVEDEDQLLAREKYYIMNNECVNNRVPFRTEQENKEYHAQYREDNKDHIKEKQAQWYQDNKDHIKEHKARYYEANKEKMKERIKCPQCQKELSRSSLTRHINTQHSEDKEKIKERDARYYEENKEKINAKKQKERINCPRCDMEMRKDSLKRHLKTQHKE